VGPAVGKAEAPIVKDTPTPVPTEVEGFMVVTADDLLEAETEDFELIEATEAPTAAEENKESEYVLVNGETKSPEVSHPRHLSFAQC
jgi:hypothetical protein